MAGSETGMSTAYEYYVKAFETAKDQHSGVALWGRVNAAQLAMEFKEAGQAMKLLLPVANTHPDAWTGIPFKMSEGLADGTWHYVS